MTDFAPENVDKKISQLTHSELVDLVILSTEINALMRQIVLIKCALVKSEKEVVSLKKVIDEALKYKRPARDSDWENYGYYLHEIKDLILSLESELNLDKLKELLIYLA